MRDARRHALGRERAEPAAEALAGVVGRRLVEDRVAVQQRRVTPGVARLGAGLVGLVRRVGALVVGEEARARDAVRRRRVEVAEAEGGAANGVGCGLAQEERDVALGDADNLEERVAGVGCVGRRRRSRRGAWRGGAGRRLEQSDRRVIAHSNDTDQLDERKSAY